MPKTLLENVASLCSANLFQWFAAVFVLAELLTGSAFDSIIYIILYPAYGDIYETSVPCLITYLLPTKPVRRLIFIFYIPVVCLWNAGRKTRRRHSLCDNNCKVATEEKISLHHSKTVSSRHRKLFSYSSRKIQQIFGNLSSRCHPNCVSCLQFSYQLFLPARFCIGWFWNIVCRNGGKSADWEMCGTGNSCEDFGSQQKVLLLSNWRRRSVSWGEFIHLNDERYQTVLRSYSKRLRFYRLLPLKSASRLWGRFNQLQLPIWLRGPALHLYIWTFGCCLEDALMQDLTKYKNLCEFFQRSLRPGIRPIQSSSALVSPVDGTVLYFGVVQGGALEQVKGIIYSLRGFLGPTEEFLSCINTATADPNSVKFCIGGDCEMKASINSHLEILDLDDLHYYQNLLTNPANSLYQCIVYLAPGDYHRFHSPADWTVYCRRHFPGELFSVNPGFVRWLQGLFNFNERAVYVGKWQYGFFSMAAVGATNVGSINVHFDKTLSTNVQSVWETGCFNDAFFINEQQNGVELHKGEDFGTFNLGSTIVLLFEAPPTFQFEIEIGQKIKYGQAIGNH